MTVVRRRHNGNFVTIPNRVLEDKHLSLEAKGLLCYLLGRPNDWTFKLALIGPLLNIGRDKTERLFRDLIEAGYIDRIQERKDGRWGLVEYVVFDEPQTFALPAVDTVEANPVSHQDTAAPPRPEKPVPVKPVPVNQGAYIKQKETKTERNKAAADDAREPSKSLISPEAFTLSDDLMQLQHMETGDPRFAGMAYQLQGWLSKGWNADVIRQTVETVMARRTSPPGSLRYFEGAIAEAHAERDRPLPVAILPTTHPPRSSNRAFGNGTHRNGGFIRHAIKLAERVSNNEDRTDYS